MTNRKTILIIDDEPALLIGLTAIMRRSGYKVISAGGGMEGITLAQQHNPDLIISDVMMPPPNGFEVRKILSKDPILATTPFIFLTARSQPVDRIQGIRQGADDYITKPFQTDELLARVEAVFRRVDTERERGRNDAQKLAAEEMERFRREISQNINHELRTPLTNVIMPLEMVVSNKFSTPDERIKFIRSALSNLDRLESISNDFIVLANMDQNNLNNFRQPLDPQLHLIRTFKKRLARYEEKNLQLQIDLVPGDNILAPRFEFIHAAAHLADNAFKFSPDNSPVNIRIEPTGGGGGKILFTDYGPGIPDEFKDKVFERYFQISQGDTRAYGGLGVGLTIAKAVAENNRGTVKFMPVASGCSIQIELPPNQD